MRLFAVGLVAAILAVPVSASAATLEEMFDQLIALNRQLIYLKAQSTPTGPSIAIDSPEGGWEYGTTGIGFSWFTYNITRDMLVEGSYALIKKKGTSSAKLRKGTFTDIVRAGEMRGSYTLRTGDNPLVPGTYVGYLQLRECTAKGCGQGVGAVASPRTKKVQFSVTDAGADDLLDFDDPGNQTMSITGMSPGPLQASITVAVTSSARTCGQTRFGLVDWGDDASEGLMAIGRAEDDCASSYTEHLTHDYDHPGTYLIEAWGVGEHFMDKTFVTVGD